MSVMSVAFLQMDLRWSHLQQSNRACRPLNIRGLKATSSCANQILPRVGFRITGFGRAGRRVVRRSCRCGLMALTYC